MKKLERIIHDDSNGLAYILVGEVYLPLLTVPNETREIGFYGSLHRNYLKDYKNGLYSYLSLSGNWCLCLLYGCLQPYFISCRGLSVSQQY